MNCDHIRPWIDPYTDDELDLARALELEEHLKDCPACTARMNTRRALAAAVQQPGLYAAAPAALRERLLKEGPTPAATERPTKATFSPGRRRSWLAAAALLLLAIGGWWTANALSARNARDAMLADVIGSHVRSLMVHHETDVISTDQHTVKPWFVDKLDFSPVVVDTEAEGYPLVGGRLDYLGGRPVAAIVYHRAKHVINLFTWPAAGPDTRPGAATSRGFHAIQWTQAGMRFWAVSDLNEAELQDFVRLIQARVK